MLALNRKLIGDHNRVMEQKFSLDGLVGFDMNGKAVGIIGAGSIGSVVVKIFHGFGCRILVYDKVQSEKLKNLYHVQYASRDDLYSQSDIITLHVPLNTQTKYLINECSLNKMKQDVMLINTSRGKPDN